MPPSPGVEVYAGIVGGTRSGKIHFSCVCGVLFATDVFHSVNATRDPALAAGVRAGTINRVRCPSCGVFAIAEVPVVYHDQERRLSQKLRLAAPRPARGLPGRITAVCGIVARKPRD